MVLEQLRAQMSGEEQESILVCTLWNAFRDMRAVCNYLLEIWRHRGRLHHALDDIRSALQEEQGRSRRPSIRQHHSP